VGALLRFPTLGVQSLWFDESFTLLQLRQPLGDFLAGMDLYQSTPPLYYFVAWPWERVVGDSAIGMRSLSAIFGTVTVPVVFLAGRALFSIKAGLLAAALVATSPTLVWYSQEARPYALLILLTSASLLFLARELQEHRRRDVALFAVTSALAIATHYFAAFLVVPAAVVILWRRRDGLALGSLALIVVAGLAVLPLALAQRARGGGSYIAGTPVAERLSEVARQFVTGQTLAPGQGLGLLAGVMVVFGLFLLVVRTRGAERRTGILLLALAGFAVGVPAAMGLAGENFLLLRNVLSGWVPLALVAAAGFAARRAGRLGLSAGVILAVLYAAITVGVAVTPSFQRSDWRGIARAMNAQPASRAIVVQPGWSAPAISIYLPGSYSPGARVPVRVSEVWVLGPEAPAPGVAKSARTLVSRLKLGRGSVRLGRAEKVRDLKLMVLILDPPRLLTGQQIHRAGLTPEPGTPFFDPR